MNKYLILTLCLFNLIFSFAQKRVIQEKEIKAIEARMVDLKSSIFLADSLFEDYIENGKFYVKYESNPHLISSGSSLLYTYYSNLSNKYGKKCSGCKMRADSLNQQIIAENNLENDMAYRDVINAADKHFNQKNFPRALELYKRAVVFRSSDPYPKSKVEEVEQLLFESYKQKQFDSYISAADSLFAAKDFENAREKYLYALTIKATDSYAVEKIVEIDFILEDRKKSKH